MDSCATDILLFNDFKRGDDKAFAQLYHLYADRLLSYASGKLESLDDAHDIIHDLFVYIWENRAHIEIKKSFSGYLFLALNRRILNHYRKNSYKTIYAEQLKRMEEQYFFGPDSYVEAKDVQHMVDVAIGEMPNKVREIYLLSREAHLSNTDIAQKLNISEQTVKNQLSTAMSILRKWVRYTALLVLFIHFYSPFK